MRKTLLGFLWYPKTKGGMPVCSSHQFSKAKCYHELDKKQFRITNEGELCMCWTNATWASLPDF
ncbi:hypothetical protein BM1_09005 [Bipolaris maydis]|nr:hypothetical protein BM1_09005 [Bipolaris maydis]